MSLNVSYTLDSCQLNLSVNEASLQFPEQSPVLALLFSSNFNYELTNLVNGEQAKYLDTVITNWHKDLEIYLSADAILDNSDIFLGSREIPTPIAAGDSYNSSQTISINDGSQVGDRYLLFAADRNDSQRESNENNSVLILLQT